MFCCTPDSTFSTFGNSFNTYIIQSDKPYICESHFAEHNWAIEVYTITVLKLSNLNLTSGLK
jgi:hypothetical protein